MLQPHLTLSDGSWQVSCTLMSLVLSSVYWIGAAAVCVKRCLQLSSTYSVAAHCRHGNPLLALTHQPHVR